MQKAARLSGENNHLIEHTFVHGFIIAPGADNVN
jgi:hypothetical protein